MENSLGLSTRDWKVKVDEDIYEDMTVESVEDVETLFSAKPAIIDSVS